MNGRNQLIVFDIDGTLTDTTAIDDALFAQSLETVCGFRDFDRNWGHYAHTTDSGILSQLYQDQRGRLPSDAELTAFIGHFCAALQDAQARNPALFTAQPGADRVFAALAAEDVPVGIATGGWRQSARLKLQWAGIPAATVPASFADDAVAREAILRHTIRLAGRAYNRSWNLQQITYIGDGFWDFKAAVALGIRFIGFKNDKIKNIEGIRTITHFDQLPPLLFA